MPTPSPFSVFSEKNPSVFPRKIRPFFLENGYVVVHLALVFLGNTLRNPDDVSVLLFLQFDKGEEYPKVEGIHEGQGQDFHLLRDGGG